MIITNYTADQVVDAVETAWTEENTIAFNFKSKELAILEDKAEHKADIFFNSRNYADVYDYIVAIKQELIKHIDEDKDLYTDILIMLGV